MPRRELLAASPRIERFEMVTGERTVVRQLTADRRRQGPSPVANPVNSSADVIVAVNWADQARRMWRGERTP